MAYRWFKPENIKSIPEMLYDAVKKYKDKPALIFHGLKISYAELYNLSSKVSQEVTSKTWPNSRIAIMMPNLPQFVICYYATLMSGRIAVPIKLFSIINDLKSKRVSQIKITDDIKNEIVETRPDIIFVVDFLYPVLMQAGINWPCTIVVTSPADFLPFPIKYLYPLAAYLKGRYVAINSNVPRLKNWIENHPEIAEPAKTRQLNINLTAQFQFTGGTTGNDKAVILTHGNLSNNILQMREAVGDLLNDGQEVVLGALPFFHVYGLTVSLNTTLLCLGGTVVLVPEFKPKEILKIIKKYRVTLFPGVNLMYQKLVDRKINATRDDLASLKLCVSGAGPIDQEIVEAFKKLTGAIFIEGYGLSETSPVIAVAMPEDLAKKKLGANVLGKPVPGTLVRITDDSGKGMPAETAGEIAVRGNQVMKGYFNKPEETAEVLKDKWLYTGDIGYIDKDNCIFLIERKKEMIKLMGENVYASRIEEVVKKCPMIQEAYVIGVPDKKTGEAIIGCVTIKPGLEKLGVENQIILFCKLSSAIQFGPSQVLVFDSFDDFKNPIGKILKRKLREEVLKKLNA